jgi:hypothetical protein
MFIRTILAVGLVLALEGCTTVLGTNIATDSVVPPTADIQPLGKVQAAVSSGQFLWARETDKQMYDEAKRAALKQKGGDLLINAKITTTLTSYLALYYKTEVAIDGTAAKSCLKRREQDSR